MTKFLTTLLNMSLSAAWIASGVLLLRLLLRKAPRWLHCALWCPVALRLLLPVFPESRFSFLPSARVIPESVTVKPIVQTGITAVNDAVNPILTQVSPQDFSSLPEILLWVWAAGFALMAVIGLISYLRLCLQVRICLKTENNVYLCDDIDTPFILGVLRPRIYLPSRLPENAQKHVLAHEQAHLHRRDHLWKPLGYALLCMHWFNPLLWVAYALLCGDIEKACDQRVIRDMDGNAKRDYSRTLLNCSADHKLLLVCPLAFGEVSVKTRIRGILNYKKPTLWVMLMAVVLSILCSGSFLTDPLPCAHTYREECTADATCTAEGEMTHICTACWDSYTKPIPMLSHSLGEAFVSANATCAAEGELSATCSGCNQAFVTGAIDKTENHTMQFHALTAATCTAEGQEQNICITCGKIETTVLPATKHSYKEGMVIQPNCARQGGIQYICTGCGKEYVETLPTTDEHAYRPGINGTEFCIWCGRTRGKGTYSANLLDGVTYSGTGGKLPSLPEIVWDPAFP